MIINLGNVFLHYLQLLKKQKQIKELSKITETLLLGGVKTILYCSPKPGVSKKTVLVERSCCSVVEANTEQIEIKKCRVETSGLTSLFMPSVFSMSETSSIVNLKRIDVLRCHLNPDRTI